MLSHSPKLVDQITSELLELPDEQIKEVLDFVGYIKMKRKAKRSYKQEGERGSVEAIIQCMGSWKFSSGERKELEEYIKTIREMADG